MKKLWITAAFLAFGAYASAQTGQQPNDDQLQQQAPRETQTEVERAARIDAVRAQSNQEVQAERQSQEKASTKRVTSAQTPSTDTVRPVKDTKPQVQPGRRRN
jgi:hypothetical protein